MFCVEKTKQIDYKDVNRLIRFTSERGKMVPRRVSGTCARHQRLLAAAIKKARFIALLAFVHK
ncbi:MAG: 30S ribosomal protein S18 [Candidatus Omnitrophica bacterium]|nr:30S ribosomal protein S18 [Candidatus Omnitrophota bacterium]